MEKNELLRKINKEMKSYINEATFISLKCRSKLLKILGEEFSVKLPIENYKNIDVSVLEDGTIVVRGEEYHPTVQIGLDDLEERYHRFKERADNLLKKNEINYYNMHDKSNMVNILILFGVGIVFIFLVVQAIEAFLVGDFLNCVWLFIFMSSWLIPGIRSRLEQAITFIKRKLRK